MRVCATAPGKTIWFGEHFVVLGKPAIASSINLYVRTCLSPSQKGVVVESVDLGEKLVYGKRYSGALEPFKRIIDYLLEEGYISRVKPFHAVIESSIPVASGLGSSAASAVSFAAALLTYHDVEYTREDVSRIAYEAEKIVHGKPSGIDNTIATYGGFIYYRNGSIKRIRVKWPSEYALLILDTGVKRNTGQAVRSVIERYNRQKRIMDFIYKAAEKLVYEALKHLRKGDIEGLAELININHGLLVTVGVAILETERLVHTLLREGALAAKITGAGMGGSVMALAREVNIPGIKGAVAGLARRVLVVKPSYRGVTVKKL